MVTTKRKATPDETKSVKPRIKRLSVKKRTLEPEAEKPVEPQAVERKDQPALVINVQSWATPILGLVMLLIGLAGGYLLRPLILGQVSNTVSIATPATIIPTTDPAVASQKLMESVLPKVRHFRGDPDAPVTMIEFGDFQCPFCGRFFVQTEPQINQAYIESGKVRFGYFNFAFLGPESTWSAEAAECAADQDKFWEYHDKLYNSQSGENQGAFSKDNLKAFAEELGLDTQAFNECLDSGKYTSLVQQDTQFSSSMGVRSTPTFVINGQAVIGAQPFEIFQQVIDSLLK